ncbi:hypothetical protein [Streptomyces sp. NPDC093261]|uniref:hypothetical protein n=1 Tax=Streptomyces sp. NPDC093261 TaxID=3366037 RepID=UPI0037FD0F18
MATFSTRTVYTQTKEYIVPAGQPWGADQGEITKAALAAKADYRRLRGLPPDAVLADDVLRYFPGDDEIIIRFVVEETES